MDQQTNLCGCMATDPHVYNNYEGFDFPVDGTYYEFPILESGQFTCRMFIPLSPSFSPSLFLQWVSLRVH